MKKRYDPIKRVGLVANPEKAAGRSALQKAVRLIRASGCEILADAATAQMGGLRLSPLANSLEVAKASDLIVVFGGDGTMLRVAREVAGIPTPIVGINVGRLGFLTAIPSSRLAETLKHIWAGDYRLESRYLISASGQLSTGNIEQLALNDFVFGRRTASRMIELEVSVDGEVLTRYRCDGLIVSSPTGSTAYSLSAGGAIVAPAAEVFAITPICPHTLSNRSVIVSLNSWVQVKVLSQKLETILTADGQVQAALAAGDLITIRRSPHIIQLLHPAESSFFQTLRQKLSWSGSNI